MRGTMLGPATLRFVRNNLPDAESYRNWREGRDGKGCEQFRLSGYLVAVNPVSLSPAPTLLNQRRRVRALFALCLIA